ncbi:MAG: hypothetical protein FWE24_08505 [Defluviitaleaceae bacterium]|nr:hypothetical protein [Defluviitaleaceae bacterium]
MSNAYTKGELNLAYETKVLLIALAKIVRKADSVEEVYKAIEEMANAEGVVLKPLDEKD